MNLHTYTITTQLLNSVAKTKTAGRDSKNQVVSPVENYTKNE